MRKVEMYEIGDGRTFSCPIEAIEAEILSNVCAAIPCSIGVAENLLRKWGTVYNLVTEFHKNKDAVHAQNKCPVPGGTYLPSAEERAADLDFMDRAARDLRAQDERAAEGASYD